MDLSRVDPADTDGVSEKKARRKLEEYRPKLDELQQRLYSERKRSLLVVIQAMDTGGKDGVIRKVMTSLNPQGVTVTSFKKPTDEERRHNYLWRIERALPAAGMIGVFNRSQYEDILVPSIFKTAPARMVEARYEEINGWEKRRVAEGCAIVKFFLHISREEQKRRLQARIDDPKKNWKFNPDDLEMRALWPKFMEVYGKILERTDTEHAPWHVVPADNKWYRDYLVARIVRRALQRLDPRYPPPPPGLDKIVIPD